MNRLALEVRAEKLRLSAPFRISGYVFEATDAVVVTLSDGEHRGRGEGAGAYYLGDDLERMRADIEAARSEIEKGIDRAALQQLMPPGGGRNAVDCALWELESAQTGHPVWWTAGVGAPKPLRTTFTLGADTPEAMAEGARRYRDAVAIKVKLTGEADLDAARLRAIRAARPDVWLGVDANQGYRKDGLQALVELLVEQDVSLLEQPLARGAEADLQGFVSPVPIAADESALTLADVPDLVGRFEVVNIKLDKCGGLTEGLAMAAEARRLGLGVMVGNMVGTSLAMAPAFVLGQLCDIVDLDGPTFLAEDRAPGVAYKDGLIDCPPEVWGGGGSA
ncbi:MAG TPA: dipeptide epimerase [Allosphingosinicella sp.]|jgi:L-alanine-DL-glutamate epimerase-like enolase superfamily enzyme|nr:dipeptide epimerase [Allosphingosinicella sp.]